MLRTFLLALFWTQVEAFGVVPVAWSRFAGFSTRTSTRIFQSSADKYYNLEELEDKESCVTEVFLNEDGSVNLGPTDGPLFDESRGEWSQGEDGSFKMVLLRKFSAGKQSKDATDMGEFSFETERIFLGQASMVGNKVAMEGTVHALDDDVGDREVGFFEMIDVTQERLGKTDEEVEAELQKGKKMKSN